MVVYVSNHCIHQFDYLSLKENRGLFIICFYFNSKIYLWYIHLVVPWTHNGHKRKVNIDSTVMIMFTDIDNDLT